MSDTPSADNLSPAYRLDFQDLLLAEQLAQRVVLSRVLQLAMHCAKRVGISDEVDDVKRELFNLVELDVNSANFVGAEEPRATALRDHARAIAEGIVTRTLKSGPPEHSL